MTEKIILDVRTPEEYAQERINGSIDIPLSFIETREDRVAKLLKGKEVLIMCRTGRRAELAKQILAPHSEIENLTVYAGGIIEYKKEFPEQIIFDKKNFKIPIMRQVFLVAGTLVFIFLSLGYFLHPFFFLGALFVSGGLIFSGLTGNCLMASILGKMPFNT